MTTKADIHSSSSSSSSPPFRKLTYDVFLSFRGEDTRKNFADHLHFALTEKGIITFRDDEELESGEAISRNLFKAIEESRYAVVVLSRNYANSSWCLNEIVKMVECMKTMGQIVLPVFYDVDPCEVRYQTGDHFGKAFEKHQKRYEGNPDKVQRWKDALYEVASLSGWHVQDRYESKVIQDIVETILTYLNENISTIAEGLVGMDSHLNEMLSYLDMERPDVRIIGICGMGGIGTTTIAQEVSEMVKAQFDGVSFLQNVREEIKKNGAVHLQKQLLLNLLKSHVDVQNTKVGKNIIKHGLCTKKVLIVLDDVDNNDQLEALCDREWFGPGSRIIVTSRDEQLLNAFEVHKVYRVKPLTEAEALQLFKMEAFKNDQLVGEEILKLSKEFLKYANGHPLAIKVLGSSLRGRRVKLWSSTLDRLKKNPEKKIIDVLQVSFDGLEETEKKIFLDIACFFKGHDKDLVIRILKGDGHDPDIDIEVLMEKSMISLFGRTLWMHDLIQELGWEIVRQECREKPENYSRLWVPEEIIHVLDRNKATSAIQSILLQGPLKDDVVHSINDSFSKMDRLRLLNISNVKFSGNMKYLSNELQYLEWHECPLDSFPLDFQPNNLVELSMQSSRIKQLWKGEKGWRMLRVIHLSGSQYLTSTPDFTQVPNLEKLHLDDCTSLVEIHPSLGFLKKLDCLNMGNCKSVKSIPAFISLECLKTLYFSQCSRLKMFPKIEGNMTSLLELHLDGTSIEELPPSVERLTGLTTLNLKGCTKLYEIPENLNCVESLEQLDIGGTAIRDLSFLVGTKNLKSLSLQGCTGRAPKSLLLPASLSSLTSLMTLNLSDCNLMDGDIPYDLSSLISLRELHLCGNCFVRLPESFSQLPKLKTLCLRNCRQLELVPKRFPLSLEYVFANDCISLKDYPNQIKVLTSVESGVTTINSLTDSSAIGDTKVFIRYFSTKNGGEKELLLTCNKHTEEPSREEEPIVRLSLSRPVYRKLLESRAALDCMSSTYHGISPDYEIPKWFSNTSTGNSISIPIGDNEWKGVGTCAVFSVNTTADVEFSNYWYQITLETDTLRLKPDVIDRELELLCFRSSSDLCLTYYVPSSWFPKWGLKASTVMRARFETNNPFVVVQKCGIRLAYEQDAGWYSAESCGEGTCFSCHNNIVLLSGWLSRGDKYFNWEKFIPPSEEEYSTHVLRKNIESVLPRYLEAINHASAIYKFNLSASPAWLHNVVGFFGGIPDKYKDEGTGAMLFPAPIEIPHNLYKSKEWMGFAVQASIAVEEKEDYYRVDLILINRSEKDLDLTTGTKYHNVGKIEYIRPSHDQLLVVYIPRAQIPEALFAETSTTKMLVCFLISSPRVKFRTIGARVVYQQDIQGLADAIIRCMQKENSFELYDTLVVQDWIQLIRLQGGHLEGMSNPKERDSRTRQEKNFELYSQKYRNRDWSSPHHLRCSFNGTEISKWKWFMHIEEGNSAKLRLPPNLLEDANWLGIAICAFYRLCPKDQNKSLGHTICDSEYNVVTCRLDCDGHILHKWRPFSEFDASLLAQNVTWFLYIPRSDKWFKSCLARATFSWSNTNLTMQSCALGLVYKEDVEHLVDTLTSCELP